MTASIPTQILDRNPGGLDHAIIENTGKKTPSGVLYFDCMEDGLANLIVHLRNYYQHLGLRTLPAMAGALFQPTHHDLAYLYGMIARQIGANPLRMATEDLNLHDDWKMLRFIRAIMAIHYGAPSPKWLYGMEWFSIQQASAAFEKANAWKAKR